MLDPDPDVLRRLRSPATALRGAAFLGVAEPQHKVDSVPYSPRIPRVLGDQLTSDGRPDVRVAASLDLQRNIESGKADADVRPLVLGVDALRLRVDSQPSKPFLQIGQHRVPASVLRLRSRRAIVAIDVPVLAPVRRASIANLEGQIPQFTEHERREVSRVRRRTSVEGLDHLLDVAMPVLVLPALPGLLLRRSGNRGRPRFGIGLFRQRL